MKLLSCENDQEDAKVFSKLPISLINFLVMDSSFAAENILNLEMENSAKVDSYRFKLTPDIEKDQNLLSVIFPCIGKVAQKAGNKNIDAWCSMAYIDSIDQNAAVMIFVNEDKSAQVRLQFDSTIIDKTKGGEIMAAIVEVLKA